MSRFEEVCESFGVIKTTKRMLYPKSIVFSEKFLDALRAEYTQNVNEDKDTPIKNKREKFLKALNFHLYDMDKNMPPPIKEADIQHTSPQVQKLKSFTKTRDKVNNSLQKERDRIQKANIGKIIVKAKWKK